MICRLAAMGNRSRASARQVFGPVELVVQKDEIAGIVSEQIPEGNWSIELTWTRKLGIALAYLADELEQRQQQALDSGL